MKIKITYHATPPPLQNLRKVAIIRHIPRDNTDWNWEDWEEDTDREGLKISPSTVPMPDRPQGDSKGNTIPILPAWQNYIRLINNNKGYDWAMSENWMWINIRYKQEGKTPQAESIHCGGNYVTWDMETSSHIRLVSYHYQDKPLSFLNPEVDNWHFAPHLFWKPCSVDALGKIYRMGNGIDAYIPLIARTELWLPKKRVEFFPILPAGYSYELRGLDVYLNDRGSLSPLMTTDRNRVRTFHNSNWRIDTLGTVPVGS